MNPQAQTLAKLLALIERYTADLAVLRASQFHPDIAAILADDMTELMRLDKAHVQLVADEFGELVIAHTRMAFSVMNRQLSIGRGEEPADIPDALILRVRMGARGLDRATRARLVP